MGGTAPRSSTGRPTHDTRPTEHARAPLSRAPCASKTAAQTHLAYALTVLFPPGAAGANFLGPSPACALRAWRLAPEACVLAFARAALRRADITPPRHAQRKHLGLKPSMPSHLKHGMPIRYAKPAAQGVPDSQGPFLFEEGRARGKQVSERANAQQPWLAALTRHGPCLFQATPRFTGTLRA